MGPLTWPAGVLAESQPGERPIVVRLVSRIAFQSTRGGNLDIWVKDLSSGQTTQLTGSSVGERYPTWSPDGTRIAFTRTQDGTANVWTVNVNTRTFVQITSTTSKLGYVTPAWQPT